jgi:hypothetical protein
MNPGGRCRRRCKDTNGTDLANMRGEGKFTGFI